MPTTRTRKKPSTSRRKKSAEKPRKPKTAPPDPMAVLLATTTTGELPAVSAPGGPSARPDRPPVPPRPGLVEGMLAPSILGRPAAALALYRDPPVQEGGAEIDMCADCDVDCCTGHVIPVNIYDAWRIRSVINVPFREFLGLVAYQGAAPTHAVRIGDMKTMLVLKRRPDRSCGFLIRIGSQRRCGIHALRPDACRIFPFLPDEELQLKQDDHAMVQMHPSHCPWRWPSTEEHKSRVLQDIRDNKAHRKIDREVLSRWHWAIGVEKTPENFFQYLEDELPRVFLRPDEPSKYLSSLW